MRIFILMASVLLMPAVATADAPVRLVIAADKTEYPFRGVIRLTITYTNTSKEVVELLANGSTSGEGFPGETFEVTCGAGKKTYTIHAVDPSKGTITLQPGKSWKRTVELAAVLCSTGVTIDNKAPGIADPLPDPFGRLDDYTVRLTFQSPVKNQAKPAYNGKIESNVVKFSVNLR